MNRLLRGTIRLAALLGTLSPSFVRAAGDGPGSTPPATRIDVQEATEPADARADDDAPPAGGESPAITCARFHEVAQIERFDGRLLEARQALRSCAVDACPTFVRTDCARWLDEVQGQIPTVVFEALGDEGPLTDVEVRVGDRIVTTRLDGKAIEVSAGVSEFTFTQPSGAQMAVRVSIRPGESHHVVSVDFRRARPTAPRAREILEPEPLTSVETRPIPAAAVWAGTTTLLATALGVTLGTVAKVKEGNAAGACAPNCTDAVVSEITNYALAADVAFGVALASGVTTVILFATRPTVRVPRPSTARALPSHRSTWDPVVAAGPHAGWLGVAGRFP